MADLTPNQHANHGFDAAERILARALEYLGSPTDKEDQRLNFGALIERAHELKDVLWNARRLQPKSSYGTPSSELIAALNLVDEFASDALIRAHGLDIQAAQIELRNDIRCSQA